MTVKEIWLKTKSKIKKWFSSRRSSASGDFRPELNDQGLINAASDLNQSGGDESGEQQSNQVTVKAIKPAAKNEPIEKLQAGFDRLIGQLQTINENTNRQIAQHEELMGRIDKLPQLLESFPASAENQKRLTEGLIEQLKSTTLRNEQFIDAVEKIPTEVAKQSDALSNINHQLSAAAEADVQMAESFNRFNQSLDKLDKTSANQSESIKQMSRTFSASDRYLKYILSKQRKTFVWVFVIAMGICTLTILILAGIILYLKG
jgi:chromosome segregation ATPase